MSTKKSNKRLYELTALVVAAIFIAKSVPVYRHFQKLIPAQKQATEEVERLSVTYAAAAHTDKRWRNTYRYVGDIGRNKPKLLELIELRQYGIETSDSEVAVIKGPQESVKLGDTELGLSRVCLATAVRERDTFFVRAKDYRTLIDGIVRLAARKDIEIGSIYFPENSPFPVAKLGGFCALLRQTK